jgi:hypothetical protein
MPKVFTQKSTIARINYATITSPQNVTAGNFNLEPEVM